MNRSRRSRSETSLIGMRIRLLTSQSSCQVNKDSSSPTLQDLREKTPNRVKKFSSIFEQKPWSLKVGCNWWVNGVISPKDLTQKTSEKFKFPPPVPKFDDEAKMGEIVKLETDHLQQLDQLVAKLNSVVQNGVGFIPMKLRDNNFCLFGDLISILGLHKIVILPEMTKEGGRSCVVFMTLIIRLIDDGHFYCYVNHKMQERSIKKLYHECVPGLQQQPLLNPFNILDAYHDWISNVCNELMKHPTQNADDIAICIEAEKKLMDLLDVIADAGAVSHIAQISDVAIETHFKIYNHIKKREKISQPMLFLVPNKNFHFGYRYPVSVEDFAILWKF